MGFCILFNFYRRRHGHEIFNALTDTQWTKIKRAHGHESVWSARQLFYAILTDFV
jgi:hypothetical protein